MGDGSPQGCHPLPLAEVAVDLQDLLALLLCQVQVHSQVLEIANEGACSMQSAHLQFQQFTGYGALLVGTGEGACSTAALGAAAPLQSQLINEWVSHLPFSFWGRSLQHRGASGSGEAASARRQ